MFAVVTWDAAEIEVWGYWRGRFAELTGAFTQDDLDVFKNDAEGSKYNICLRGMAEYARPTSYDGRTAV
jgi:hypothetical protein